MSSNEIPSQSWDIYFLFHRFSLVFEKFDFFPHLIQRKDLLLFAMFSILRKLTKFFNKKGREK